VVQDLLLGKFNGYIAGTFTIWCSVLQGCTENMLLFATVLDPADMFVGATSYEHQNWTSDKENRGDGIRRRCQIFVMSPSVI